MIGYVEPRVYTPPLRELTPETSLGYDAAAFADEYLSLHLTDWQRWLLVHLLEVVGDLSGEWRFRFRTAIVLVGRQNGKSTIGVVLALYFLFALEASLVLGAAQDLSQAEEVWEAAVTEATDSPMLAAEVRQVMRGKGSKEMRLTRGRRYRAATPNRKNMRGKTCDLVLLDELREHRDWDAWNAAAPTIKARRSAMVLCLSNAGDPSSVVLRHFRAKAHAAVGDPDGFAAHVLAGGTDEDDGDAPSTLGIFEWSAAPGRSVWDRDGWAEANPSLGRGFLDEESVASDASTFTEAGFRTEDLCQWVESATRGPFPDGAWEAGRDESSEIAQASALSWGVDVASDRSHSSIAVCGQRPDGTWHVELAEYRAGTKWLVDWFRERAAAYPMRVALQARGAPVSPMADVLSAIDGVEVIECGGPDLAGWCGAMWDAVAACLPDAQTDATPVHHVSQPFLDVAAAVAATKPMGDGAWVLNRDRSPEDISPLFAATMAFGLATRAGHEEKPEKYESAYADRGVLTV